MQKGFTLLELLIVIGILAILSTVAVLVLNPAELLRQARDSQRINDLAAIHSALATYSATVSSGFNLGAGNAMTFTHGGGPAANAALNASSTMGTGCSGPAAASTTTSSVRTVSASGWLPVNFAAIPGGSPLSVLPVDPSTGTGPAVAATTGGDKLLYYYASTSTTNTWKLTAEMESARYQIGGANDVENTDGGTCSHTYEIGTTPALYWP